MNTGKVLKILHLIITLAGHHLTNGNHHMVIWKIQT
jgi:hypothetical protein